VITLAVFATTRVMYIYIDKVQDESIQTLEEFGVFRFVVIFDVFMSLLVAFLSACAEIFWLKKMVNRRMSIGLALLLGILVRTVLIIVVMLSTRNFIEAFFRFIGSENNVQLQDQEMLPLMITLGFTIILCGLITEIDRKLGPGNLWKFLTGKFYKPHEEERIFMFVDMKDSTRHAEQMGHLQFSRMLRDCFQDFSVVDNYEAEIYQYVGDEVVISWPREKALKQLNFLHAFYAFTEVLEERSAHYQKHYGVVPFFKAGVHIGPVIVSEVGDIKREISYHGDTINTAARIQGMCNNLKSQLLISENVYHLLPSYSAFILEDAGAPLLKGKEKEISLFRVQKDNSQN
jgi:adenylate cyclase